MATTLPRPGVEVEQRFVSESPTILIPSLPAVIIGPSIYIVDAFNADGTPNTDSKITTQYLNAALTVLQSAFPDPRAIITNVNVDEDSIRVFLATGTPAVLIEVLRTETFLGPAAVSSGDALDDGSGGTTTSKFVFADTAPLMTAATIVAGDRVVINGFYVRQVVSAADTLATGAPGTTHITLTLDQDIPLADPTTTAAPFYIIAASDLTGRSLTGDLTLDVNGSAVLKLDLLRNPNGSPITTGAAADVYIQYEALRRDVSANPLTGSAALLVIDDQDQLDSALGPVSLRNPLATGVLFALINSPTHSVNALGVDETSTAAPQGTLASYNRALSFLEGKEVYGMVPLTQDAVIHQAFFVHVNALSAPDKKRERVVMVNQVQPASRPDVTRSSGALANTILRSGLLTGGFSTAANRNARLESDLGSALVTSGVVVISDLIDVADLRDAELYIAIAGGTQKFLLRTVVGFDLEIVDALAADGVGNLTGPTTLGTPLVRTSLTSSTFTTAVNPVTLGIQVGDILRITASVAGTGGITPITGSHTITALGALSITVSTVFTAANHTDATEYEVLATGFQAGGFANSDPGSPFANQLWAVKTLGEVLVVAGTNPPIPDRNAIAEVMQAIAGAFGSRRLLYVQPDSARTTAISGQEDLVPGYYLACAVAGMTGEQPPQQGFTNFPVAGFTGLVNSNDVYSDNQIAIMAAGGVYMMIQEAPGSAIVSQHQLTTDLTSIETREFSVTKDVDYTAKFLRAGLRRFIGRFNITPEFLDTLSTIIQGLLSSLVSKGVLNGAQLRRIAVDETQPDSVIVEIVLDVPLALNFLRITLIV
jgi:hypothetical protein